MDTQSLAELARIAVNWLELTLAELDAFGDLSDFELQELDDDDK